MYKSDISRRLQIFETNYGRETDWLMEYRGRAIALLTDVQNLDMFLDSYRVKPLTEDADVRHLLMSSPEFWKEGEFEFRNMGMHLTQV